MASSKTGNGEWKNGEWGTGNGEWGISKRGESLKKKHIAFSK